VVWFLIRGLMAGLVGAGESRERERLTTEVAEGPQRLRRVCGKDAVAEVLRAESALRMTEREKVTQDPGKKSNLGHPGGVEFTVFS
jgi:hypothetical protein